MAIIFRNKVFLRLFAAMVTSQLGSTIGSFAFAFYLVDRFSSQPSLATLAELMYSLPTLFVFFIVGVCADRLDRRQIAEYCDWIRFALTMLLMASISWGILPVTFGLLFLRSAIGKFFYPAESALVQGILDEKQYVTASGLNQMVAGLFMVFGVSLGALVYMVVGIQGAITVDAVSFLVSAILIRSCTIAEEVRLPNGPARVKDIKLSTVIPDFKAGLDYILSQKLLISLIFGFFMFGILNGGFSVLPLFTMKYKLAPHDYEKYTSIMTISLGIGFLVGSLLGSRMMKRWKPHQIMIGMLLAIGVLIVILGQVNSVWAFMPLTLLLGTLLAPLNVAIGGWVPSLVEPAMMGRTTAWVEPLMMLAHSATLGCISILYPKFLSLELSYWVLGITVLIVFVFYGLTLPKLTRQRDEQAKSFAGMEMNGATAVPASVQE